MRPNIKVTVESGRATFRREIELFPGTTWGRFLVGLMTAIEGAAGTSLVERKKEGA